MAQTAELSATARPKIGKGAARAIRREGRVPAVIYGDNQPPVSISMAYNHLFKEVTAGSFFNTIYILDVDGEKSRVIPRDVQFDPVRDFPMHVDFLRVGKGTTITVDIPVRFINEDKCEGLTLGGVLNVVRHDIELSCRASAIPEVLEIDLAGLGIGDSAHASDLNLPEGTSLVIDDRDFTIATIAAPSTGETEASADDEEEEEFEEIATEE
ncbi:MAG: 50S ribosomal protein L25 [Hyphomicrobiales bacterium]|nr:MAG: 50S ribosomal protein L25 [Hyphomicrobiales bacterium]